MKTNKQKPEEESSDASVGSSGTNKIFEAGDFVRSTFAEDGVDYEAEIISINENNTCLIRFIGYGNEERVKMEELVDSWGPEAREEQKILAEADQVCSNGVDGNHQEELFSFVADKAQGSQKSLPVPPMVRFSFLVPMFDDTDEFSHSPQCHQECLTALKTLNT